ncbi:ATP-dependent helicase [Roseovarius nubinhibens]|uniref:UvrD-helicase domain-containing protein n=1 Tax=Roseovarius nubinhibens TaxID=314263 RepID=UPI001C08D010|nr:ATP-dependent helicase [Roseovarius nubinhibens]MBU3000463.1 ATP-dependent helicase [Roseovarius nubinhibens]
MSRIDPASWRPSNGVLVDEKTLSIITGNQNLAVLAGPGAGKTEMLAQRASFLLQTAACRSPRRILAISFKVDAAKNLQDRVQKRCDENLAKRFESLTLDAFAKRILDQFKEALPRDWQPTTSYSIFLANRGIYEDFSKRYRDTYASLSSMSNDKLERVVLSNFPTLNSEDVETEEEAIRYSWWKENIRAESSKLTFDMIKIMARYIVQSQPKIGAAIRDTYSHVFLDEFQDVTARQYALIKACFGGSDAVLTAVGDNNQAIMRWAGAEKEIFQKFTNDFQAQVCSMNLNFRSNPHIVDLINTMAGVLWDTYEPATSPRDKVGEFSSVVQGWISTSRKAEAERIAQLAVRKMAEDPDAKPSDICVLARMHIDRVEEPLQAACLKHGLKVRNDARKIGDVAIQDLTKDDFFRFVVSVLKLATSNREGSPFETARNTISQLRGYDLSTELGHSKCLKILRMLSEEMKTVCVAPPRDTDAFLISDIILRHFSADDFKTTFREYKATNRFEDISEASSLFIQENLISSESWRDVIASIEGSDAIQLMTIHKSKGLEFKSVIFVELNDEAFWGNDDDANVFFVALSRAREEVVFSVRRDTRGVDNVMHMYEALQEAGVEFSEADEQK